MKRRFAVVMMAVAAWFGAPVCAQTVAPGPYYATPSWDQTLPASTRFIVLSNMNSDAVLDRETGLVWTRAPNTTRVTYAQASAACLRRTTGNRAGWRLPTVNELASLFDPAAPPLPAGHPFTGIPPATSVTTFFWSTTPEFLSPTLHHLVGYGINFSGVLSLELATSGNTGQDSSNGQNYWCVRGGLQPTPQ